jgi:serine/threonine protein kinase
MCDQNVFAVLIPCDKKNLARDAFRLEHNADWYRKAAGGIAEEPTIDSREPTPAPQPSFNTNYDSADRILLTFDKKPKDPGSGWQFGTDQFSDVLLGHRGTIGISGRHFTITIDEDFCVWLRDDSRHGTAVGYDGKAKSEVRKQDTWILSFKPWTHRRWNDVTIYVPNANGLAFKIEFPNHEAGQPEYLANLRAFFQESRTAFPPVSRLGLNSNPTTAAPSRPRTPRQRPIYLDDGRIGQGEFGEVRRVIHASTGQIYATKKFYPPPQRLNDSKKRKLDEEKWLEKIRNEIAIMKDNPHVSMSLSCHESALIIRKPNIMPVIEFQETPNPLLLMPYYSLGNLQDLPDVSEEQYVSAFRQILLGLRHLHGRGVAHRDLKPANFLVEAPFTIVIADFGFSKVATDRLLTTFCGTHKYAAPEVYSDNGYKPLVDIWSTGVIVLELIYELPDELPDELSDELPDELPALPEMGKTELQKLNKCWSERLVKRVRDLNEDNDQVIDILLHMLKIKPEERFTADQCLERGCDNGLFRKRHDGHIVGADDTEVNTPADGSLASTMSDGDLMGPSNSDSDGGFDLNPRWVLLSRQGGKKSDALHSCSSLNDLKEWYLMYGLQNVSHRINLSTHSSGLEKCPKNCSAAAG